MDGHDLLRGQVALVTGGSSGIGAAIVRAFIAEGADAVIIADLRSEPREGGRSLTDGLAAGAATVRHVPTDVAKPEDLARAVAVAEELGGLTAMVNCAGVFRQERFFDIDPDEYEAIFRVNVRGTFFACQAAARAMRERGGSITNLSSTAAYRGSPDHAAYHASKGAVQSLTYALARDLAPHRIRVNAIHPGAVDTAMLRIDVPVLNEPGGLPAPPMGRVAVPDDIAGAAVYLASDLAAFVSGASLTVDGAAAAMG